MDAEKKDINFFDTDLKHAFNVENALKPEEFFSVFRKEVPLGEYEMNYKFDYVLGNSCFAGTLVKYKDNYQKTNFCRIADKTLHFIIYSLIDKTVTAMVSEEPLFDKLSSRFPVQFKFCHASDELFKRMFLSYLQDYSLININRNTI